jgi:GT2 family glycosyltransferase
MIEAPPVAITIVTYNSARYIAKSLETALSHDYPNKEVVVVDNASHDETAQILAAFENRCRIVYNSENTGFAAAQNQAISLSHSRWVLTLNPDVLLMHGFIKHLVEAGETDERIGTVCGKLLAISPSFDMPEKPLLDSTGIFLTTNLRHFDRGSRVEDLGQYEKFEYVFGATGAAALYRRKMIEDIAIGGEFFDHDFFAYREDADVAWRAQLLGWTCVYTPMAHAYHVRTALPSNRRDLPPEINMHSVKNRWLLRVKNMTLDLYRRYWLRITLRDLTVLAACLLRERSSLKAFSIVARTWGRQIEKRKEIMKRRRADNAYMRHWLSDEPASIPAPEVAERVLASSGLRAEEPTG